MKNYKDFYINVKEKIQPIKHSKYLTIMIPCDELNQTNKNLVSYNCFYNCQLPQIQMFSFFVVLIICQVEQE